MENEPLNQIYKYASHSLKVANFESVTYILFVSAETNILDMTSFMQNILYPYVCVYACLPGSHSRLLVIPRGAWKGGLLMSDFASWSL